MSSCQALGEDEGSRVPSGRMAFAMGYPVVFARKLGCRAMRALRAASGWRSRCARLTTG